MRSNMTDMSSLREKEVPCYTSYLVPDLSYPLEGLPFRQGLSSLAPVSFSVEEVTAPHLPTQGAVEGGGGGRPWEEGKKEVKVLSMKILPWRMNATDRSLFTFPPHI